MISFKHLHKEINRIKHAKYKIFTKQCLPYTCCSTAVIPTRKLNPRVQKEGKYILEDSKKLFKGMKILS